MFRSVNGIIGQPHESVTPLRLIVSHAIRDEPMLYSEAFLGRPNADYQTWILSENAWGGAIDLPILSHHFKLELAAFDVKTMRLDRYGENKSYLNIGYLIYDGIHYNYVALALGGVANLDADITQFDANDSLVYHHVRALAQKEHDAHNYTDTASFSLKCGQCGMKLKGETQAVQHAKATGHSQFDENK